MPSQQDGENGVLEVLNGTLDGPARMQYVARSRGQWSRVSEKFWVRIAD